MVLDSNSFTVGLRGLLSLPRRDEGSQVQGGDVLMQGCTPDTVPAFPSSDLLMTAGVSSFLKRNDLPLNVRYVEFCRRIKAVLLVFTDHKT